MTEPEHRIALAAGYGLLWYRVERVLGQGGFGITYLAEDTNLHQPVAIKEFLPVELALRERDDSVQPVSTERAGHFERGLADFLREARTLARFDHPSIVRVLSVFEANNTAYMVMRYEDGQSLAQMLPRRGTLAEGRLLAILHPVLDGLALVHEAGFIHRDIKPPNLYVRADGSPVLLDFGSARRALGEVTRTLTSMVSPGYAPFEQYHGRGDRQGPWTDIYGLGATCYRALLGVPPMDAMDRSEGLLRTGRDPLVTAAEAGAGRCDRILLDAVDRALAFRDEDRPRSIEAWLKILPGPGGPGASSSGCAGTPPPASPFGTIELPDDGAEVRIEADTAIDSEPAAVEDRNAAGARAAVGYADRTAADDRTPKTESRPAGASPVPRAGDTGAPLVALLSSFIGDANRGYYLERFVAWAEAGRAPWLSWNRGGLGGPLWFVYRRMRLWGLVVHPVLAVVLSALILAGSSAVGFGGGELPPGVGALVLAAVLFVTPAWYGNRVYFRRALARVAQARARHREAAEQRQWLARAGGRSRLAPGLLGLVIVALLVAALTEPARRATRRGEAAPAGELSAGSPDAPALLEAARHDIRALRLSTPRGNNAMEKIRAVLAARPDSQPALALQARVLEAYKRLGRAAAERNDLVEARRYLDRALEIAPDAPDLLHYRRRLERLDASGQ